jgi:hypothetical protein
LISLGFDGRYEMAGQKIVGWAKVEDLPPGSGLFAQVYRGDGLLAWAPARPLPGEGLWEFGVDVASKLEPRELLSDQIRVLVVDRKGSAMKLRIEGMAQLHLISEYIGEVAEPILEIDFSQDGNCADYILDGWSFQEETHRWMTGEASSIAIKPADQGQAYNLIIQLWPFTIPDRHPEQRLDILMNDDHVGTFTIRQQMSLKCRMPAIQASEDGRAILTFVHPDTLRPRDFFPGDDDRCLTLAVKKLKITPAVVD